MGQIHRGKGNKLQLAPDFPFRHLLGKFNSRGGDVPVIIISGKIPRANDPVRTVGWRGHVNPAVIIGGNPAKHGSGSVKAQF